MLFNLFDCKNTWSNLKINLKITFIASIIQYKQIHNYFKEDSER